MLLGEQDSDHTQGGSGTAAWTAPSVPLPVLRGGLRVPGKGTPLCTLGNRMRRSPAPVSSCPWKATVGSQNCPRAKAADGGEASHTDLVAAQVQASQGAVAVQGGAEEHGALVPQGGVHHRQAGQGSVGCAAWQGVGRATKKKNLFGFCKVGAGCRRSN